MKACLTLLIFTFLLLLATPILAQSSEDYHPLMSDRFNLGIGIFHPDKTIKLQVDGSQPDEEIDFTEALKLDDNESTVSLNFRWRFGEKWSFWGQYWSLSDSGGAVLTEPLEWEDVVFQEGTFAEGGLDTSVGRLFFGRIFSSSPRHEFGLGAGLHWLELDAFLAGQVLTNQGDTEFYRGDVDAGFPLPNIGGWYMYSWSPKWLVQARLDWLSASVGDYSGGLWNAQAGINFAPWKHIGIGLYYNYFNLNVDIEKSDWRGGAESTQNGPYLALIGTW
jgi:hypothetical protein